MVRTPGEGEVDWEFRGLRCMSWKEGAVNIDAPNYDRHAMPTFKKRSTFLETSVANLALVMGDGLRLQSFVLICADSQTRVQKMSSRADLLSPRWATGKLEGNTINLTFQEFGTGLTSILMEIEVRLPTNMGSSLPERPLYTQRNAFLRGIPHCPWTLKVINSPIRSSSNGSPLGRRYGR